jgi:YidC/Oxa1 family membrane protein insertase
MGWDNTLAFLILPAFLVVSQFVSMELMQPKPVEGQPAPQNNLVLKVLPLMIGWFALNVPAALSVYWVTNNIITTATSVFIRNSLKSMEPIRASSTPSRERTASTIFAPPPPKPSGFGERTSSSSVSSSMPPPVSDKVVSPYAGTEIKPITAIDAEIVSAMSVLSESMEDEEDEAVPTGTGETVKKRGTKKRKKRKT